MNILKNLLGLILLSFACPLFAWNLSIKPLGSKTITLQFTESTVSLDTVKNQIVQCFAERGNTLTESSLTLLHRNIPLAPDALLEQNTFEKVELRLLVNTREATSINTVTVKALNGSLYSIKYNDQITAEQIKAELALQMAVSSQDLVLIYNGKPLDNTSLINKNFTSLKMAMRQEYTALQHLAYFKASMLF